MPRLHIHLIPSLQHWSTTFHFQKCLPSACTNNASPPAASLPAQYTRSHMAKKYFSSLCTRRMVMSWSSESRRYLVPCNGFCRSVHCCNQFARISFLHCFRNESKCNKWMTGQSSKSSPGNKSVLGVYLLIFAVNAWCPLDPNHHILSFAPNIFKNCHLVNVLKKKIHDMCPTPKHI